MPFYSTFLSFEYKDEITRFIENEKEKIFEEKKAEERNFRIS